MNIDFRLARARQLMIAAIPDPTAWSGPAACEFERRLGELLSELEVIQAGLWR